MPATDTKKPTRTAPRKTKANAAKPHAVEQRSIDAVKPYGKNPRKNEDAVAAVAKSISEFGFRQAIVVDRKGFIIAGHTRWLAAKSLGMTEVPVHVATDLKPAQVRAYRIADNRVAEIAGWDNELLAAEIGALDEQGFDLELLGFTSAELLKLQNRPRHEPENKVEDAAHRCAKGDVWLCGEHRLMCGDSTNAKDIAELFGDHGDCSLVVTSPPYNCGMEYDEHDDNLPEAEYLLLIESAIARCHEVLRDGCFVAWNVGTNIGVCHLQHARMLVEVGLTYVREVVWAKPAPAFPLWRYTKAARGYFPNYCHELIYLFSKGDAAVGAECEVSDDYSSDVWKISPSGSSAHLPRVGCRGGMTKKLAAHPACFPMAVPDGLIRHLTNRGEVVFDPFVGTGTTMMAADELGRLSVGMDCDPHYIDFALARWEQATGSEATLQK